MTVDELSNLSIVGCVNVDGATHELYVSDNDKEFFYENEAGYITRIETANTLNVISIKKSFMECLNNTISEKLMEQGLVLPGFIYCKDAVYIINFEDSNICALSLADYMLSDDTIDLTFTDVEDEDLY